MKRMVTQAKALRNDHIPQLIFTLKLGQNLPYAALTKPLSGGPFQGVAKAARVAALQPDFASFPPSNPTRFESE